MLNPENKQSIFSLLICLCLQKNIEKMVVLTVLMYYCHACFLNFGSKCHQFSWPFRPFSRLNQKFTASTGIPMTAFLTAQLTRHLHETNQMWGWPARFFNNSTCLDALCKSRPIGRTEPGTHVYAFSGQGGPQHNRSWQEWYFRITKHASSGPSNQIWQQKLKKHSKCCPVVLYTLFFRISPLPIRIFC